MMKRNEEIISRWNIIYIKTKRSFNKPVGLDDTDFLLVDVGNGADRDRTKLARSSTFPIHCCVVESNLKTGALQDLLYPLIPHKYQSRKRKLRPELWPSIWARKILQRLNEGILDSFKEHFNEANITMI